MRRTGGAMDAAFKRSHRRDRNRGRPGLWGGALVLLAGCTEEVGYLRVKAPELVLDEQPVALQLEGRPERVEAKWSVYPEGVATLDETTSALRCVGDGDVLVQVVVGSNSSSAAVSCRRSARLVVPEHVTLVRGRTKDLVVRLQNAAGDPLPDVPLELSVDLPSVVDVRDRSLTGHSAGTARLKVTAGPLTAAVELSVVEPLDPAAAYSSDGQRLMAIDSHGRIRELLASTEPGPWTVEIGNSRIFYYLDARAWVNELDGRPSQAVDACKQCGKPMAEVRLLDEGQVTLASGGDVLLATNPQGAEIARFPLDSEVFAQGGAFAWTDDGLLRLRPPGKPVPEAGIPGWRPIAMAHDGSFVLVRSTDRGTYGGVRTDALHSGQDPVVWEWPELKGDLVGLETRTSFEP